MACSDVCTRKNGNVDCRQYVKKQIGFVERYLDSHQCQTLSVQQIRSVNSNNAQNDNHPDNHRELQPSKAFEVHGYQETEYPQHLRPSNPTVKRTNCLVEQIKSGKCSIKTDPSPCSRICLSLGRVYGFHGRRMDEIFLLFVWIHIVQQGIWDMETRKLSDPQ